LIARRHLTSSIGGAARTGRTKVYNLHYVVLMLGYLGELPFFTAANNQQDIVPVDWVAAVISDIMPKDEFHQGVIRMPPPSGTVQVPLLLSNAFFQKPLQLPGTRC